jgi:hypothetical protein
MTPHTDITLDDVDLNVTHAPLEATAEIRTVDPPTIANHPSGDPDLLPAVATLGSPSRFAEPYASARPDGVYSRSVSGSHITQTCEASRRAVADLSTGQPSQGFTELLVVLTVAPAGAEVRGVTIRYSVQGSDYVVRVPWDMVACGRAIGADSGCLS